MTATPLSPANGDPLFQEPRVLLLLGDSITQYGDKQDGWATLLREHYQAQLLVHNLGISGLNTRNYLTFLNSEECQKSVLPARANYIAIGFGANDAAYGLQQPPLHQGIPLQEYRQNMASIINFCRHKYSGSEIIILAPPDLLRYEGRTRGQTREYQEAAVGLANEYGLKYVVVQADEEDSIWTDGLHMNSAGNRVIYEKMSAMLGDQPYWVQHWTNW